MPEYTGSFAALPSAASRLAGSYNAPAPALSTEARQDRAGDLCLRNSVINLIAVGAPQQSILVVEDDPDLLRIMVHTLQSAGYRVVPAYGGEDALRKIRRERFAVVLTDLAMPKMSGVELIEILKRNPETAFVPVIAVTAHWMESFGNAANDAGCEGHLQKPFRSSDLLKTVANVLKAASVGLRPEGE